MLWVIECRGTVRGCHRNAMQALRPTHLAEQSELLPGGLAEASGGAADDNVWVHTNGPQLLH